MSAEEAEAMAAAAAAAADDAAGVVAAAGLAAVAEHAVVASEEITADPVEGELAHGSNRWAKTAELATPPQTSGKFSKEESETVRRAIEEYCATKNTTPARLCSECDHKTELKGAWMEIARALPHRTVQSVYRHGLRQLHPFKRGAWSDEEVKMLVDHVERYGKKWAAIQAKLNRSADSCRDKHREINREFVKGRWKDDEIEALKRLIREVLKADPTTSMEQLAVVVEQEKIILPWSDISKRMGNRSRLSCFKKWQKMTGTGDRGAIAKPDASASDKASAVDHGASVAAASAHASADAAEPPTLGGDTELTPNPIGDADDAADNTAAQIAAETVEAVDLPILEEQKVEV